MSEILLSEKYRPKKLSEAILPSNIKSLAEEIISSKEIPNLLFCGKSGIGKTTLAKVLAKELDYETLYINASDEGRSLDTVRTTIKDFAISTSLTGSKKVVILDEFCGCTSVVQDALKAFFEEYSKTCAFILTANNKSKINAPIISRFTEVDFTISKSEEVNLKIAFAKRVLGICESEGIETTKEAIIGLVKINFPDYRKILNHLQIYKARKKFTVEDLSTLETPIEKILDYLRNKNYKELVGLVTTMPDVNIIDINRQVFEWTLKDDIIKPQSKPMLVLLLQRYNFESHFAQDMVVCVLAEFIEIMGSVEFI